MLPYNASCPSWTGCYLTHYTVKLGVYSIHHQTEVVYMILALGRPWRHKKFTWRGGPNTHGPYSWYTAFSFPACKYGLMGSSLPSLDREREDLSLIYRWFRTIFRHHAEVDSYSIIALLWDIPIGHWWREILPVSRNLGSALGFSLCLEGKIASFIIICWSWAVAKELAGWSGTWKEHDWKIGDKEVWGRGM